MIILFAVYFFFFKQKTAYEMRISDWSSDVCSSDLRDVGSTRRRDDGEGKIEVPVGQVGLRIALSLRCVEALIHRHAAGRLARGVDHVVVQEQHGAELDDAEEQHQEDRQHDRSEEHTSELQSLMRNSYAVFCLKKKKKE